MVVQPGVPAAAQADRERQRSPARCCAASASAAAPTTTTPGCSPLTGAPAIEGSTPNTTFESAVFFPQSLTTANYFGALGWQRPHVADPDAGAVPHRPGPPTRPAHQHRAGLLPRGASGSSTPARHDAGDAALAAPPRITDVARHRRPDGTVTFSAAGDRRPVGGRAAGVGHLDRSGPNANGNGTWAPVDLSQDPNDSTRWTGTLNAERAIRRRAALPGAGRQRRRRGVRSTPADGDGYGSRDANALPATVDLTTHAPTGDPDRPASPLGVTAQVIDARGPPVAGRDVRVHGLARNGETKPFLYRVTPKSSTDGSGGARDPPWARTSPPVGDLHVAGRRCWVAAIGRGVDRHGRRARGRHARSRSRPPSGVPRRRAAGTRYPPPTPLTRHGQ